MYQLNQEPSSTDGMVVKIFEPYDLNDKEAEGRRIPSPKRRNTYRPTVVKPLVKRKPADSTELFGCPIIHPGKKRRMQLYSPKSSSELTETAIVLIYVRSLSDPSNPDRSVEYLLNKAAKDGRVDVVEALLSMGSNPNSADSSGRTPLHEAGRHGRTETIHFLLTHGADVEAQTNVGRTALHEAAYWGHFEAARVLLEAGAKPDPISVLGITPMDCVRNSGREDLVQLLLDHLDS